MWIWLLYLHVNQKSDDDDDDDDEKEEKIVFELSSIPLLSGTLLTEVDALSLNLGNFIIEHRDTDKKKVSFGKQTVCGWFR